MVYVNTKLMYILKLLSSSKILNKSRKIGGVYLIKSLIGLASPIWARPIVLNGGQVTMGKYQPRKIEADV